VHERLPFLLVELEHRQERVGAEARNQRGPELREVSKGAIVGALRFADLDRARVLGARRRGEHRKSNAAARVTSVL
jgi:hypothetical protein